ncbi:MAG: Na+/H+ antiporter subunit E [Promicromonosporaceae bacterium]|nr:Na+/H+ antiporter subunit E [Promicromonosporaceae bacterium]
MKPRLRSFWRYLPIVITFLVVWIVMVELLNWLVVAAGVGVAIGAIVLTNVLLKIDYASIVLTPWATIRYVVMLLREMTIAAVGMIWIILTAPGEETEFVHESALTDDLALFLLANTVILTPGSVAVEREDARLHVITADPNVARAKAGVARLERSIARLKIEGDT